MAEDEYGAEDEFVRGLDEDFPIPTTFVKDIKVNREKEIELLKERERGGSAFRNADSMPNMIVDDWMYLGNMDHAAGANVIKELGITHIVNCSLNIPWYLTVFECLTMFHL